MQAVDQVMGYFMRHGVVEMMGEVGGEYPRVVANHALPGTQGPAELAGGLAPKIEPHQHRQKFLSVVAGTTPHKILRSGNHLLLLVGIDRPQTLDCDKGIHARQFCAAVSNGVKTETTPRGTSA